MQGMLDGDGDGADTHEGVSEAADDIDEYLKELSGADGVADAHGTGSGAGGEDHAADDDDLDAYLGELDLSGDEGNAAQESDVDSS